MLRNIHYQKLFYYTTAKYQGFYTCFPAYSPRGTQQDISLSWRWFEGNVLDSFFPFTFCTSLRNSEKPYFLFSVALEDKRKIIAKHKVNLRLGLSQLEEIKEISIKPGMNF